MNSWKAAHKKSTVLPLFPITKQIYRNHMFGETKWEYSLWSVSYWFLSSLLCWYPPVSRSTLAANWGCLQDNSPATPYEQKKRPFILNALIIISLSWSFQILTCKLLHFPQFLCLSATLPPHCLRTTSAQPISTPTKKTSLLSSQKSTTIVQLLELWLPFFSFSSLFALPANCVHRAREVDWFWAHSLFCTEIKRRPTTDPRPSCPQPLA